MHIAQNKQIKICCFCDNIHLTMYNIHAIIHTSKQTRQAGKKRR